MTKPEPDQQVFNQHRNLLFSVAYRILGTAADAEDAVQDAWIKWSAADRAQVAEPKAYLTRIVSNVALERLRSTRYQRETYVGPWLPEPLMTDPAPDPSEQAEMSDSLSIAFLAVLESLSPVERAVYLLREVFGYGYDEIARVVDRSEDNCRQLATRARRHIEAHRPRFAVPRERQEELTERFMEAVQTGDDEALVAMLAEDAVAYTDGGGKVRAAPRPIAGREQVARFLVVSARRGAKLTPFSVQNASVNGRPGRVLVGEDGAVVGVLEIDVDGDLIRAVRIVNNPDKLRHLHA